MKEDNKNKIRENNIEKEESILKSNNMKPVNDTKVNKENRENGIKYKKKNNLVKDWIIPIISAIIIALLINKFLIFNAYVPSGSMIPTLNIGDKLAVTRIHNKENLKRGDIVVFYSHELGETLVKRLIGLPGDKIEIKNGVVFINGEELKEDYVKNGDKYNGTYEVPEGKYFFLGDNRSISYDSRKWVDHYIDGSDLEGKVQFKFYPLKDFGSLK